SGEKLLSNLEKGDFQIQIPYILNFFNKKTNGITTVGIGSVYPFDLYPFFTDISDFSEKVILAYEPFYGRLTDFISSLFQIEFKETFNFFSIDVAAISAFGEKVYELRHKIKDTLKQNYFGIISEASSIYLPPTYQRRNYISEVDQNIFFVAGGSNICIVV
ncbi:MAG: hypothetical protein ACE5J9_02540, partial [Methanosarcinales archaeon]